ncbi:LemA family protein [Arsenicicoccus sp. oral taxon 190]|uniref:LemA family protein n=1 Tax=Arsenicicoccus sp. oral taxon 190 TaxID=1658671 RepID=UPI000A7C8C0F|nr:LemA family protein [Arsenicicoccus sp. oral taxon 190]
MTPVLITLIVLLVIIALIVMWLVGMHNSLIGLRNRTQESWRQIDVELKRRHDLIPNLVETVKGFATHERGTLDDVMSARAAAVRSGSNPAETAAAEQQLTGAIGRLMAVAEAYPQLQANSNFLALQQELSSTEDRIASGRRYYNATVRELNTKVESFPSNMIAKQFGIHQEQYFEAEAQARSTPQVNFDTGSARTYETDPEPAQGGPVRGGAAPAPTSAPAPAPQPGQGQPGTGEGAHAPAGGLPAGAADNAQGAGRQGDMPDTNPHQEGGALSWPSSQPDRPQQ